MASWLVCLPLELVVWVPPLARDTVLHFWARHFYSLHRCINGKRKFNAGGNHVIKGHPIQGGVVILLVTLCYRNWDKLQSGEPLGSYSMQTSSLPYFVTERNTTKLSRALS